MIAELPYRKLGPILHHVRRAVRSARLMRLRLRLGSRLQVGHNVILAKGCDLRPWRFVRIGSNVSIGKNFTAEVDVVVGNDVLISSNVSFVGNQHHFDDSQSTVFRQGRIEGDTIRLEGDNLIGFGAIVVGSITIGRGCIVGAGSVVTRDLPPDTICAGTPARILRPRYPSGGNRLVTS